MNWFGNQMEGWLDHGIGGLGIALEGISQLKIDWLLEAIGEAGVWCIALMGAILLTPFAIIHVLLERGHDVN
jgi:hypothetical protein